MIHDTRVMLFNREFYKNSFIRKNERRYIRNHRNKQQKQCAKLIYYIKKRLYIYTYR